MIKICKDKREIDIYKKYFSLKCRGKEIPILLLERNLFFKARDIFSEGYVLIEVRDDRGKILFYLKSYSDTIEGYKGAILEVDINYDGCDLQKEKNLDTSLLEKAGCFVFEELEEYTFELTEFIRNRYPDTQIFYLDQNANLFWEEDEGIVILNSIYNIETFWQGRYVYICSDVTKHEQVIPEGVSLIYNSENIMNSLCWARKAKNLGTKNSDKTILLIDMDFGKGQGLAYIIRTILCFVCMAHERGWIPVVNLNGVNMYMDSPGNNMWEQYFEPLSHISVRDALKSRNVISVKNNHLKPEVIYINPYFREIWNRPQKHPKINFKNEIMQYFVKFMPEEIQDKQVRVLGAFIRGTDAREAIVSEKEAINTALECKEIMENYNFDKVFLATEDLVYFEAFKSVFKDNLLCVEQKRAMSCQDHKKSIGELLDIKTGEKINFGLTYLMITYCLSQCEAMVYNMSSGGYYLANKWRENPYEFLYHIGRKSTEVENVVRCLEMVEENTLTAIYGTGDIGKRLLDIFKWRKKRENIIFCDKKAEDAEYLFDGYRVVQPSLLLEQYKNGDIQGIIIASALYAEEMYNLLIRGGVNQEHILVIKNQDGTI